MASLSASALRASSLVLARSKGAARGDTTSVTGSSASNVRIASKVACGGAPEPLDATNRTTRRGSVDSACAGEARKLKPDPQSHAATQKLRAQRPSRLESVVASGRGKAMLTATFVNLSSKGAPRTEKLAAPANWRRTAASCRE